MMTQEELDEIAAMPHGERVQQVVSWTLGGMPNRSIRDSIAGVWPEISADELIAESAVEIKKAGGFKVAAMRHIYSEMMGVGDFAGAARILKEIEDEPLTLPFSAESNSGPADASSVDLEDLLDGLSFFLTDDASDASNSSATPATDPSFPFDPPTPDMFVPPSQRENPGQTSRSELERRYHQVASWLVANNFKKGVAKRLAREAWGIGFRQYEAYHKAAYQILNEAADVSHEEEYRRACLYYDHIMETTDDDKIKVAARKAKDELAGIQKARKVAQVGRDGQVVDPVAGTVNNFNLMVAGMTDEQLRTLAASNGVLESIGTKGGVNVASNASAAVPVGQ